MEEKIFLLFDNDGNIVSRVVTSDPTLETDPNLMRVEVENNEENKTIIQDFSKYKAVLDEAGKFKHFTQKPVEEVPVIKKEKKKNPLILELESLKKRVSELENNLVKNVESTI